MTTHTTGAAVLPEALPPAFMHYPPKKPELARVDFYPMATKQERGNGWVTVALRAQPAEAATPDTETVSLIARARLSMQGCVAWEKDRDGRPPSQLCVFEIQDAEEWMKTRGIDVYAPHIAGAATPAAPALVAMLGRDQIRAIFMQHGFTIKEGQTDLKQYVYDAAEALLAAQREAKP